MGPGDSSPSRPQGPPPPSRAPPPHTHFRASSSLSPHHQGLVTMVLTSPQLLPSAGGTPQCSPPCLFCPDGFCGSCPHPHGQGRAAARQRTWDGRDGARRGVGSAGPALPSVAPAPASISWSVPSAHRALSPEPPCTGPYPCVLLSPPPLLASLLTCSPARHPAATPWWTAPSAPIGLRSLVGPSAGDNHTTAAGGVGLPGPALRQVTLYSPQE